MKNKELTLIKERIKYSFRLIIKYGNTFDEDTLNNIYNEHKYLIAKYKEIINK